MNQEGISQLMHSGREVAPPARLAAQARLRDFEAEYARSVEDPEGFWAGIAHELEWFRPWDQVFQWTYPTFTWFAGARCNITHNCLDRQVTAGRGDKVAYIWAGEDGSERRMIYGELLDRVCRAANGLRSLGVKKGDRVLIYMPLCIEGVTAMLACARAGAVHSVVNAGFSVQPLRSRIEDAGSRVIITADSGYRRGKRVPLKPIVDEANRAPGVGRHRRARRHRFCRPVAQDAQRQDHAPLAQGPGVRATFPHWRTRKKPHRQWAKSPSGDGWYLLVPSQNGLGRPLLGRMAALVRTKPWNCELLITATPRLS